jgi:hypothetical protein
VLVAVGGTGVADGVTLAVGVTLGVALGGGSVGVGVLTDTTRVSGGTVAAAGAPAWAHAASATAQPATNVISE